MHQIWTNPSLQRNVVLANGNKSEMIGCLKWSKIDSCRNEINTITVMPGLEYAFKYMEPDTGNMVSIKAIAIDFFKDCIKVKCIERLQEQNSVFNNCHMHMGCQCIENYTVKNDETDILFIPTANIINIKECLYDKRNKEVRVLILGISAEIVKAIVINMSIFDDRYEDAVKKITLEAGKIYDISYMENNTIYNCTGKIVHIEEDDNSVINTPPCCHVREHVRNCDSYYMGFDDVSKEEFMNANPVNRVKIIMDTSEMFSGDYETIFLDSIRDCTLVDNELF